MAMHDWDDPRQAAVYTEAANRKRWPRAACRPSPRDQIENAECPTENCRSVPPQRFQRLTSAMAGVEGLAQANNSKNLHWQTQPNAQINAQKEFSEMTTQDVPRKGNSPHGTSPAS